MLLSLAEHLIKEICEVFAELSAQLQQKNRNPFFSEQSLRQKSKADEKPSIKTINRRTRGENC